MTRHVPTFADKISDDFLHGFEIVHQWVSPLNSFFSILNPLKSSKKKIIANFQEPLTKKYIVTAHHVTTQQ